jgi:hypothetical protein
LDGKIWLAAGKLSNGRAAGASRMRAKHVKEWLQGIKREENPAGQGGIPGNGDNWHLFLRLIQAAWTNSIIPCQLLWIIVILIPNGGGNYHDIGLLEPIWKVIEQIIDHRLDAFEFHNSLYGCRNKRGMETAIIEAKLAQQLSYLKLKPFYGVFLDLHKVFDAMDRERCIMILEGYRAGPWLVQLVHSYWRDVIMVCWASSNYSTAFKAGRGVTQGSLLSAKLFNILVDAVVREWIRQLRQGGKFEEEELLEIMVTLTRILHHGMWDSSNTRLTFSSTSSRGLVFRQTCLRPRL